MKKLNLINKSLKKWTFKNFSLLSFNRTLLIYRIKKLKKFRNMKFIVNKSERNIKAIVNKKN